MAANILDILAERQVLGNEYSQRHLYNCTQSHPTLVERLGFACELEGHKGCVNCIQWNSDGSLLLSGSDDMTAILWDPFRRKPIVTMPTGHTRNIFSVKFAPFSGDCGILTGAEDKDVKLHDLHALETRQVWSCSSSRVKRLAVSPHSPYLCWSAAEDGCIRQMDIREPHTCSGDGSCRNVLIDLNLTCAGGNTGGPQFKCIDVNPVRSEQIAVGALDAFVRVYDTRILSLRRMTKEVSSHGDPSCLAHFAPGHISNPICKKRRKSLGTLASTYVSYSPDGRELLVNLSGEHIYLFDTTTFTESLKYEFNKTDSKSVPTLRPHYYTSTCTPPAHYPGSISSPDCHVTSGLDHVTCRVGHVTHLRLPNRELSDAEISVEVRMLKEKGHDLCSAGLHSQAISCVSQAILMCPTWHVLYSVRAGAFYARRWDGDYYAALRDTETALTISPTYKKAHQRRLRCLLHLGWRDEAKALYGEYLRLFPGDSDFHGKFKTELDKHPQENAGKNGISVERKHLTQWEVTRQHTAFDYKQRYCGHCNTHTDIKEANFIGERGDFIAAGSDDGNIFIWEKSTARLVRVLHGDESIVNCVQWHPTGAVMASSGIESVVRLWEPKCHDFKHTRIIADMDKACKENQHRMGHDPFEVMLMRMGFNIAVAHEANEAPPTGHAHQRENRDEGDSGGVRWIEDPSRCRQS